MSEETSNVLTFSELRKKQKQEDKQEDLLELDETFLLRASNYFQQKKETEGESREYKNARRVLDKIISLREEKIVKKARLSSNSGLKTGDINLLPEEQELFRDIKNSFKSHQEKIDEKVESDNLDTSTADVEEKNEVKEASSEDNNEPETDEENDDENKSQDVEDGYKLVKITSSVPEFMGTDLEAYGPFEEGDKAKIPEDNAEILVNRGNAEVVN